MVYWLSIVYNTFTIVGILILLCTVWSNSSANLTGSLVGYSFLIVGILLLLSELLKSKYYSNTAINFSYIFITLLPVFILLGSLIYMIYMISTHFDRITQGHVSSSYYNFMIFYVFLLIGLLKLFYNATQSREFKSSQSLNVSTSLFIYLIEIIYIVIIITLGIILTNFFTDG